MTDLIKESNEQDKVSTSPRPKQSRKKSGRSQANTKVNTSSLNKKKREALKHTNNCILHLSELKKTLQNNQLKREIGKKISGLRSLLPRLKALPEAASEPATPELDVPAEPAEPAEPAGPDLFERQEMAKQQKIKETHKISGYREPTVKILYGHNTVSR